MPLECTPFWAVCHPDLFIPIYNKYHIIHFMFWNFIEFNVMTFLRILWNIIIVWYKICHEIPWNSMKLHGIQLRTFSWFLDAVIIKQ